MTQYSATQLAEKLGYSRASIANLRGRYNIPGAKRIGHLWTYTDESVMFIKSLKSGPRLGSKNKPKKLIKGE